MCSRYLTILVYGLRTPNVTKAHTKDLYAVAERLSEMFEPGATPPVDIFPFLKWIPERMLGTWRSRALEVKGQMDALYGKWYNQVKERRKTSNSRGCFLDRVLDEDQLGLDAHSTYTMCGP